MDLTALMKLGQVLSVPCKIIKLGREGNVKHIIEFTLQRNDNVQYQLFFVPPYTYVPDHTHPDVTTLVTPISGLVKARRGLDYIKIQGRGYGKTHVVKRGEVHGFETFDEPFIFMAQQIWRVGMDLEVGLVGNINCDKAGLHLTYDK